MAGEVFYVDGPFMPPQPGSHSNSRSFRKIIKFTAWCSREFFYRHGVPRSLTAGEASRMPCPMQKGPGPLMSPGPFFRKVKE